MKLTSSKPFRTFSGSLILSFAFLLLPIALSTTVSAQSAELSLADLLIGLRSQKAPLEDRNRILAEAVRERGITFVYTPEIAKELAATGASTDLLAAVLEKGTPPAPKPTPIPTPTPPDFSFYKKRADTNAGKGEFALALADYDKAAQMRADEPGVYLGRALVHFNMKAYDRSVADYDRVLELNPKAAAAYNNRGESFEKLGESEKALADYRNALEVDPENTAAKANLKRLEDEIARAAAKAAEKAKPPRPEFLDAGTLSAANAERLVMPVYSSFAQRLNIEGKVSVAVEIDEEGNVVKAESNDGHKLLRDAAEDAARKSKFKPFMFDGTPIRARGILVYSFNRRPGE
jgi:tetratricopeptide (TPR) repeat protein